MSRREKIDFFLRKWISRKLTVFTVASFGLFNDVITSTDWVIVATSYIAIEGVSNVVERLMKAKQNSYEQD